MFAAGPLDCQSPYTFNCVAGSVKSSTILPVPAPMSNVSVSLSPMVSVVPRTCNRLSGAVVPIPSASLSK